MIFKINKSFLIIVIKKCMWIPFLSILKLSKFSRFRIASALFKLFFRSIRKNALAVSFNKFTFNISSFGWQSPRVSRVVTIINIRFSLLSRLFLRFGNILFQQIFYFYVFKIQCQCFELITESFQFYFLLF